jgi:hypothetical protein
MFFRLWKTTYEQMLNDFDYYEPWARRYAGGDQAALGCLIEQGRYDRCIEYMPCRTWNATQSEWEAFNQSGTRFVHVKSDLRKLCLGEIGRMRNPATPKMGEIARLWKSYEED